MAEKKEDQPSNSEGPQPQTMPATKPAEKLPDTTLSVPTTNTSPTGLRGICNFHKTHPNELYRKLLPAVLFLMTFVTVMTMLLVYMDTVALGAQQFRLNMSRDYELSRIRQDEPSLVAYVRQLHTTPRHTVENALVALDTDRIRIVDEVFGSKHTGTFVEILPDGPRDPSVMFLEARGWRGVVSVAAPPAFLTVRARTALHACLSPTAHPREVSYHDSSSLSSGFSSRVLCLPLYTILLSADLSVCDWVLLSGHSALPALKHTPFEYTTLRLIEVRAPNETIQEQTTAFLKTRNYEVKATFADGVMYILHDKRDK